MMLRTFADYRAYLERLTAEHPELKTFVMGTSERVLRRQSTNLQYPLAWCAFPDIAIDREGNERYAGTIFFLDYAADDEDDEDAALTRMLKIARSFHRSMKRDHDQGLFDYSPNETVFQVKPRVTGDNDHGYVIDFDLILGGPGCDN